MRTTATAAHLDAILDDIGTVVIEGAAAFAILRTDATDLHGRHLLQQRWTQMLVVAKQLRELHTALLQIHIQMAAKRGNQRLDFSAKVETPLTWRKIKIRGDALTPRIAAGVCSAWPGRRARIACLWSTLEQRLKTYDTQRSDRSPWGAQTLQRHRRRRRIRDREKERRDAHSPSSLAPYINRSPYSPMAQTATCSSGCLSSQ